LGVIKGEERHRSRGTPIHRRQDEKELDSFTIEERLAGGKPDQEKMLVDKQSKKKEKKKEDKKQKAKIETKNQERWKEGLGMGEQLPEDTSAKLVNSS
jgi:hypothetical protein